MAKAIEAWRKARSVELALQGMSYDAIAKEVGYANRGTAWRTVMKALAERTHEAADQLRFIEGDRLDQLQKGIWGEAMAGDLRAVDQVLKIIHARIRLFGLDQPNARAPEIVRVVIDPAELAARGEAAMRRDAEATEAWYVGMLGSGGPPSRAAEHHE